MGGNEGNNESEKIILFACKTVQTREINGLQALIAVEFTIFTLFTEGPDVGRERERGDAQGPRTSDQLM
jgi:hypothetical protein